MELSPAAIRYLLAIHDLSANGLAVRSVDIARSLSVTPSSVVHMLGVLCGEGLTAKRHYGSVQLTNKGTQVTRRLAAQLNGLEYFFSRCLHVSGASARADALSCLSILSQESIEQMLDDAQRQATPLEFPRYNIAASVG